jgi:hypothetical protein
MKSDQYFIDRLNESPKNEEMAITMANIIIKVFALFSTPILSFCKKYITKQIDMTILLYGTKSITGYKVCGLTYSKNRYNKTSK